MRSQILLTLVPLFFSGGVLYAQTRPPEEKAWLDIVVPASVEVQLMDKSGHFTGIDFDTKKVSSALPDSNYDPFEAMDDDVSGKPDAHASQHLVLAFVSSQRYILRIHPKASGTFRGEIVLTDRMGKDKRMKFIVASPKRSTIKEYQLFLDPMNAGACRLTPSGR